jgi:phosphotriesterase-related protein
VKKANLAGKVQTVLGLIEPENLGITLSHEHIISDGSCWFMEPNEASEKAMAHHPVTLDILWWLRYHFFGNLDNLLMQDEQEAIEELAHYRLAGGNSIVEMSNIGIGRDPAALMRISRATGLNIIMGSGYYVALSHGPQMDSKTEDEITEEIVQDVFEGVGTSNIRSGIIGEIGCSWPLTDNERKSLRSAARAQRLTGAPLSVHPSLTEEFPTEILQILHDAGADLSRTVFCHMERTLGNLADRVKLAKTGCYLEYDTFGREGYCPWPFRIRDLPDNAQRIDEIRELIDKGYINQILISHDIWTKTQRRSYGGWGYGHILRDIVPAMLIRGMTREQINTIIIENPKRLLTFL